MAGKQMHSHIGKEPGVNNPSFVELKTVVGLLKSMNQAPSCEAEPTAEQAMSRVIAVRSNLQQKKGPESFVMSFWRIHS
jgi:hypothetical protein